MNKNCFDKNIPNNSFHSKNYATDAVEIVVPVETTSQMHNALKLEKGAISNVHKNAIINVVPLFGNFPLIFKSSIAVAPLFFLSEIVNFSHCRKQYIIVLSNGKFCGFSSTYYINDWLNSY